MKIRPLRFVLLPLALVGPAALSHVYIVNKGVHFKLDAVDFGQPPREYALNYSEGIFGSASPWRPGTTYLRQESSNYWDKVQEREGKETAAYQRAKAAEKRGDLHKALSVYRGMLRYNWGDIGFVRERVRLLEQVGARPVQGIDQFLAATPTVLDRRALPLPKRYAPVLAPYVEYHLADREVETSRWRAAAARFERAGRHYPNSPQAPACLIMAARTLLQAREKPPTLADMRQADSVLRHLLSRYPGSSFTANAHGWLGRIDYLQGRYEPAIRRYRIQERLATLEREWINAQESMYLCYARTKRMSLGAAQRLRRYGEASILEKETALSDFRRSLHSFTAQDARAFWQLLQSDHRLLGYYFDYRLDHTEVTPDLLVLGRRALGKRSDAHVLARLSEAALRLRRSTEAERFASQCLASSPKGNDESIARFVRGTVAFRRGALMAARRDYRFVVDRHPKGYLAGAARENLAIIAERRGELEEALEHYGEMGYDHDFAYLADARMTPEQLAGYLLRSDVPRRALLTYTLGMRYLRRHDWDAAERTFQRLTDKQRRQLTVPGGDSMSWVKEDGGLQDPLVTTRALKGLSRDVRLARDAEAKAGAMLMMANYFYSHHDLLLYSPRLWNGTRAVAYSFSWNDRIASSADRKALERHHWEHECFAQALGISREILRKYPNTKAAARAAYRGGCAAERLAHMAPYWRWQNQHKGLLAESVKLMNRATKTEDAELRRKATKYAKVFAQYRDEARGAFGQEGPPARTWNPQTGW